MTKFVKEDFNYHGGYLTYQGRFVARFKYATTSSKGPWITFMIKNFTVEEYFERLVDNNESPLEIVESKGFILSHIKKWMKDAGFPATPAGYKAWSEENRRQWEAKFAARQAA